MITSLLLPRDRRGQHPLRSALALLGLAVSVLLLPQIGSANDRLLLPAIPTALAPRALMLDIARAGERLVAVGDRGFILLSDDAGQNWRQAAVPVSVALTAVHFVDDLRGWAVGHSGVVLHTTDGGEHWQLQLDGNRINRAVLQRYRQQIVELQQRLEQAADESQADELTLALEELQYQKDNAEIALEEGATKPLLDVWFRDRNEGWAIGAYGLALYTQDGGQHWRPLVGVLPNPDGLHLNRMAALDASTLFIAGEAGSLYRSRDNGSRWERIESPYDGSFFGIETLPDGSVLAYGLRGNAFLSRDGGDSWQALEVGTAETITAALVVDGRALLLGGGGSLWRAGSGNDRFRSLPVVRRLPLAGAVALSPQRLVVVGVGGIRVFDLKSDQKEG